MSKPKTPYDVIRSALDYERLGSRLDEAFESIDVERIREAAELLVEFADAVDSTVVAIEQIGEAETGEERAEAREAAFEELDSLVGLLNQLPGRDEELLDSLAYDPHHSHD